MTTPVDTTKPSTILTGWQHQALSFQATSTSQVLQFLAVGTPSGAPPLVFLDGITITETPEPGALGLLGLGVLMLGVARLRKRSS